MNKVAHWIESFRLRTLPLSLSGVILASLLAYSHNKFNTYTCIFAIVTTLFLQILSNLANDLGDSLKGTDNQDRKGPERAVQSGKISVKEMKIMIGIFTLLSMISGLLLIRFSFGEIFSFQGKVMIGLGALSVIAAIKYTLGKKAYGYIGLGDIFVYIFFGLVSVMGTYYLHSLEFPLLMLLPASSIGLLAVGVLNMNNIRDIRNDKESGKRTIPVIIGEKNAKRYHFIIILLALIFLLIYTIVEFKSIYNFTYIIGFIPIYMHLKQVVIYSEERLDKQLKIVALSTLLISLLFGISQMI
jgi:1,4-dihydroxy-2-naphthoate octaprenyltransferase